MKFLFTSLIFSAVQRQNINPLSNVQSDNFINFWSDSLVKIENEANERLSHRIQIENIFETTLTTSNKHNKKNTNEVVQILLGPPNFIRNAQFLTEKPKISFFDNLRKQKQDFCIFKISHDKWFMVQEKPITQDKEKCQVTLNMNKTNPNQLIHNQSIDSELDIDNFQTILGQPINLHEHKLRISDITNNIKHSLQIDFEEIFGKEKTVFKCKSRGFKVHRYGKVYLIFGKNHFLISLRKF